MLRRDETAIVKPGTACTEFIPGMDFFPENELADKLCRVLEAFDAFFFNAGSRRPETTAASTAPAASDAAPAAAALIVERSNTFPPCFEALKRRLPPTAPT